MSRPISYTPSDGKALTLDELSEFVAEAYGKGLPGSTYVRAMGVIEFDMAHGPRIARLTAIPGQEATS